MTHATLLGWIGLGLAMSAGFACSGSDPVPGDGEIVDPGAGGSIGTGAGGSATGAGGATAGGRTGAGGSQAGTGGSQGGAGGGSLTGSGGGSTGSGGSTTSATGAVPSAGCGSTAALPAKMDWSGPFTIPINGKDRIWYLHLTSHYTHQKPATLLIGFHGCGCKGGCEYWAGEIDKMDPGIGVYPEAVGDCWDAKGDGDDAALFDALHKKMIAEYCVDMRRVFVAGFSSGAMMSNAIACARGDVIKGAAPASGSGPSGTCKGPVPWIGVHGNSDGSVPFSSGIGSRDTWIKINGCSADNPLPYSPEPTSTVGAKCVKYQGCKAGFPVDWCEYNGGHETQATWGGQAVADFFNAITP